MKKILIVFSTLLLTGFNSLFSQTQMPVGGQSSTFTGMTRGYHFTSPTSFNMCALYIPQDASAGTLQSIWVVRFNTAAPPAFPGTTTAYTTLFTITGAAANTTVACNVNINAGDIIGIYGSRNTNCVNSYDGVNFATTIMGMPTTLSRSGTQNCINGVAGPTFPIWSETAFSIGRIFMYYNCCPTPTITAVASPSNICAGASVAILGGGATTYTWAPGNQNTASVTVTPTVSTTYTLSGTTAGCTGTKTVTINVNNPPSYTLTPLTTTICQGGNFTASVSLGNAIQGTPCSTIGVGPACATPLQTILGTGALTNGASVYPSPYAKWWNDCHQQYLYRATELTALGLSAGYITSLSFNVTNLNFAGSFPNYTIKMKCTTATQATAFDMTGLSTVFVGASVTPAVGWNQHNFSTPYYWDGVSNLLVDLCFNNTSWSNNASSPYTTTPFTSCVWRFTIGAGSSCGTTATSGTSGNRPNTRFGTCTGTSPSAFSYSWSAGPGIASPTSSVTLITPAPITGSIANVVYSVVVTPTAVSCPVQKTLTATIINPASPTITVANPVCNTNPTVALSATPGGGTWTTNSAISGAGILTPSLAAIGTSSVLYSVGVGSCIATGTTNVNVSQFNTAALTGTIGWQCSTMPPTNLNTIVQSTLGGVWSGPNVSGTYSFNPAGLTTGIYNLIYNTASTPNATLCPDSRTISVSVLNPITPTITQVGPYCNTSGAVALSVTPNNGAWTVTGYLSNTGIFTPALANIGQNFVQYTVGSNTCNAQETKTINVEAFIPAVITGSIADKCNTSGAINLLQLTTNVLGTWIGPGVTGFNFDPATSGTGNLTLTYNTASIPSGLCPDNASLSVNVYSLAPANITQVGPFCNTAPPVQLQVSPLGGSFGATNNNFAINNAGLFMPSFANLGDNIINYTTTAGPCVSIAMTTITIEKYIAADFKSYVGPYCKNDPPINLNSVAQNPGGIWSGPGTVNGLFTPATANIGNNNIIIYQTHSMPTASLCPDTAAMRISVNDIPSVSIISNIQKGCLPVEVIFNTPSTNTGQGLWNFGDGQTDTGLVVTHIYNTPGSYSVSFNYQDNIGCATKANLFSPISVYALPHASFDFDPHDDITIATGQVQFSNLTTVLGDNTYQWQIGNMYQLNEVNPKVVFTEPGEYLITLIATTTDGCKDQVSKTVSVKNDYGVYIPTSFSPNFDDLNDVFKPVFSPYGLDLTTGYEFEVFDRWGHSMFQTKDFTKGWDGTVQNKGEDGLKQEVYVYKIRYKDLDGKIHNKTGHVSLIK
jgi:gliding motility-associated-like protein